MKSDAATPEAYIAELPEERRPVIVQMRKFLKKHVPKGYQESMNFGMICYEVRLERCPNTYNGQPLMFVSLAAQKNHYALYLMCVYGNKKFEQELRDGFAQAGKKLDMGKACVRFKSADDLALDVLGRIISRVSVDDYVKAYEAFVEKYTKSKTKKVNA